MFKSFSIPREIAVSMAADIENRIARDKENITTLNEGAEDFIAKYRGLRSSIYAYEDVLHALKPHTEKN